MRAKTGNRRSLRKIVDRIKPLKKRMMAKGTAKRAQSRRASGSRRSSSHAPRAWAVAALVIVAAAAWMTGRQPSSDEHWVAQVDEKGQLHSFEPVSSVDAAIAADTDAPLPSPTPSRSIPPPAAPAPKSTMPEPARRDTVASAYASTPAAPPVQASPLPLAPSQSVVEPVSMTTATAGSKMPQEDAVPVTIAGCLERDDDTFWLKNTSGVAAPASRSWKSGFLRKRSSSVALIDDGSAFRLASHVGRRIETTGVLVDREMRVKSIRVQGSCD